MIHPVSYCLECRANVEFTFRSTYKLTSKRSKKQEDTARKNTWWTNRFIPHHPSVAQVLFGSVTVGVGKFTSRELVVAAQFRIVRTNSVCKWLLSIGWFYATYLLPKPRKNALQQWWLLFLFVFLPLLGGFLWIFDLLTLSKPNLMNLGFCPPRDGMRESGVASSAVDFTHFGTMGCMGILPAYGFFVGVHWWKTDFYVLIKLWLR